MKEKSTLWAKLNSNIVILILGSLITGILVPIFQNNQRTLEWRRQIKYEEVSFQIEMVRKCLAEFMTAAAFTSEAMERVMPFIEKQSISTAEYDKFKNDFVQMQNLRFRQNVKVASFAIYFDEQNEIQNLINTYTTNSTNYMRGKLWLSPNQG